MFKDNLIQLRKVNRMSQEELAGELGCSRQTVSKWETGDSTPDLTMSKRIADLFGVTLDDLVSYESGPDRLMVPPKGKHAFGCVKVGDKGQIVIPARARKLFRIQPGDSLMVLGDEGQGLALIREADFLQMVQKLREGF